MRYAKSLFSIGLPFFATGCSIHPLPDDVTRDATFAIVQKIRCEARHAINDYVWKDNKSEINREKLIREAEADHSKLLKHVSKKIKEIQGKDEKDKVKKIEFGKILIDLDRNRDVWISRLANRRLSSNFFSKNMQDSAIGYSFKLTMSETEGASGSGTFTFPFSTGKFLLGVSAGEDRERKNERSFEIVESLPEIMADQKLDDCLVEAPNWKYPITGSVGIKEIIKTYSELQSIGPAFARQAKKQKRTEEAGDKQGKGSQESMSSGGGSDIAFTEDLTFTTSYGGSLQPSIELNPVTHDFRLTKAAASFGGARKDIHKMTLTIVKGFTDIPTELVLLIEESDESNKSLYYSEERLPFASGRQLVPSYIQLFEGLTAEENAKARARRNLRYQKTQGTLEKILDGVEE